MRASAGKACKACGVQKPMTGFYGSRNADGRMNVCKPCHRARGEALRRVKRQRTGSDHIPEAKQCAKCGLVKPAAEFAICKSANDGLGRFCRECDSATSRARRYGMPEDRVRLMASRETCESCGRRFRNSREQHFDHRHSDGAVRGVLCHHCNTMVGACGERPEVLMAAARYLDRTSGTDYRVQPYGVTKPTNGDISPLETPSPEVMDACRTNWNHRLTR